MFRSVFPTLCDMAVPVVAYLVLAGLGMSPFWALTLGASLSTVTVVAYAIRQRRPNSVSLLVLLMFCAGIAVTFWTRDPRILLVKPSLFFGVIGLYMCASCLFGRPLMYEFIKSAVAAGGPERLRRYELTWERVPRFRKLLRAMTVFWGISWLLESLARVGVVYSFPPERAGEALLWTVLVLVVLISPAVIFTLVCGRRMKIVGEAFNRRLDQEEQGTAHQVGRVREPHA